MKCSVFLFVSLAAALGFFIGKSKESDAEFVMNFKSKSYPEISSKNSHKKIESCDLTTALNSTQSDVKTIKELTFESGNKKLSSIDSNRDLFDFLSNVDYTFSSHEELGEIIKLTDDALESSIDSILNGKTNAISHVLINSLATIEDESMFSSLLSELGEADNDKRDKIISIMNSAAYKKNYSVFNSLLEYAEIIDSPEVQLQLMETFKVQQTDLDISGKIMSQLQTYSYSDDPQVSFSALDAMAELDPSLPELTQKISSNLRDTLSTLDEIKYISLLSRINNLDDSMQELITQIANDTSRDPQVRIHALSTLAAHNLRGNKL